MSFYYFLNVRPWSLDDQNAFQEDVQAKFIKRATEVHPRNPRTGNDEKYREFRKSFRMLFIGKLQDSVIPVI